MAKGTPSAYDLKQQQKQEQKGQSQQGQAAPYNPIRNGRAQGYTQKIPKGNKYVVQEGESLASIAGKFGGDQRKMQALANINRFNIKYDVLQPGQELVIPDWFRGKWSNAPYVSEDFMSAAQGMEAAQGWRSGPGYKQTAQASDQIIEWPPATIVSVYNLIKAQPLGWKPPAGLDVNGITAAYKALEAANKGLPSSEWSKNGVALNFSPSPYTTPNSPYTVVDGQTQTQPVDMTEDFNWQLLPDAQRKAILGSSNFDITKYTPAVRQQILSDKNFNWDALPRWQKWYYDLSSNPTAMGAATGLFFGGGFGGALVGAGIGAIAGATGYDAGKKFNEQGNIFAAALGLMNLPAEKAEQSIGFVGQLASAIQNPEKYGSAQEILDNPKAAWEAAKSTYETTGGATANLFEFADQFLKAQEKDNTDEVSVWDADRLLPTVHMARMVYEAITNGDYAGAGEDFVLGRKDPIEIAKTRGLFGIEAWQVTDSDLILADYRKQIEDGRDPIEVMLTAQQTVGGQMADLIGQGILDPLNVMGEATNKLGEVGAKAAGNVPLAEAFKQSTGAREALQKYGDYVSTSKSVADLTQFDRWAAGLSKAGTIKELAPITGKESPLKNLLTLTPHSRATLFTGMAFENVTNALNNMEPEDFVAAYQAWSKTDMKAVRDMGAAVFDTPEAYTILPAMKGAEGKVNESFAQYNDLTPNRTILQTMATLLGESEASIVKSVKEGVTFEQEFARMVERARAAVGDVVAAGFLQEVQAGSMNPDVLAAAVKVFTETDAPYTPEMWKAQTAGILMDHAEKWIETAYKLKPDSPVNRMFGLMKSVQSIVLLGLSPTYVINNSINNAVMLAFHGLMGAVGDSDKLMKEIGVPARMSAAGLGGEAVGIQAEGALGKAQGMIYNKTVATDGLAKAQQVVSAVGKKIGIFANMSVAMEQMQSRQAFLAGMQQGWARTWVEGIGYRKMSAELEKALGKSGLSPNDIYNVISGTMNQADLTRKLEGLVNRGNAIDYNTRGMVGEVAQGLGMQPVEAAELLNSMGLSQWLDERLAKARTPEEIEQVFEKARTRAQDWLAWKAAQDLKPLAEHWKNKINLEGVTAISDILIDVKLKLTDVWDRHGERLTEVFAKKGRIDPQEWKKQYLATRLESTREWQRLANYESAGYMAVVDALGVTDPRTHEFLAELAENQRNRRYFFRERDRLWDAFGSGEINDADAVRAQIETLYRKMIDADLRHQENFDRLFVETIGGRFGEAGRTQAGTVFGQARDIYRERAAFVMDFRERVKKMGEKQKKKAWADFWAKDNPSFVNRLVALQSDGYRSMFNNNPPAAGRDAGAPPGIPTGPAPVTPSAQRAEVKANLERTNIIAHEEAVARDTGRRVPAYEQLRNKWPEMSADEQQQALNWVMNKTMIDPMTGLETLVSKSMEQGKPAGWIDGMSDLNGMKGINDTFGHPAGDKVLGGMGEVIKREVEAVGGRAFRVGGDEISYWFPDQTTADKAFKSIDENFKSATIIFEDANGNQLTKTGFTISYGSGADLAAADAALYTDKQRRLGTGERPTERGSLPGTIRNADAGPGLSEGQSQAGLGILPGEESLTPYQVAVDNIKRQPLKSLTPEVRQMIERQLSVMRDEITDQGKPLLSKIVELGGLEYRPDSAEVAGYVRPADLVGEANPYGKKGVPVGMFTRGGMPVDTLIRRLVDDGYLSQADIDSPNDNGGINKFTEMVQDEIAGKKHYSTIEKKSPTQADRWDKLTIERVLSGTDNTSASLKPTAAELDVKAEAFRRTVLEWDEHIETISDQLDRVNLDNVEAVNDLWESIANMVYEAPEFYREAAPASYEKLKLFQEQARDLLAQALGKQAIAEEYRKAQANIQAAEAEATTYLTRETIRQQMVDNFKMSEEEADTSLAILDARAEVWSKQIGASKADWYAEKIAGVGTGEGDLYSIQPNNRAMVSEEVQNYARALVRQGEDELRRAVGYEDTRSAKIALLDAAHNIDPDMARRVSRGITELFQEGDGIKRASVSFAEDGRAMIKAMEAPTVAAFLHESGHIFRRDLYDTAMRTADTSLWNDIETVEQWAGVERSDNNEPQWTREAEEKFARGFEEYLAEGKAPSQALYRVFEKVKDWMLAIYKRITGSQIDAGLTDEMRGVFDRLLADDEARAMFKDEYGPAAPEPITPRVNETPIDTGMTGGMLPGMQEATGQMFDVQPGAAGKRTQMEMPKARTIYDAEPGKVSMDVKGNTLQPEDLIKAGGKVRTVKGTNLRGEVVTDDLKLFKPDQVTRLGQQETMFGKAMVEEETPPPPINAAQNIVSRDRSLLNALVDKIRYKDWFAKSRDFETFIKDMGYNLDDEKDLNLAYDLMEGAYNIEARRVRKHLDEINASLGERLTAMNELESNLTEARRTLGKMKLQQFSTPLTISEAAGWVAHVQPGDVVGEPTAGTANLVDMFSQRGDVEVKVNEFDPGRRQVLSMLGYSPTGLNLMAGEWVIKDGKKLPPWASVFISNPPWGSYSQGKYGRPVDVPVKLNDWSQRFTYLSMMRMADDGRFVGVMPANWLYTIDRATREITLKESEFMRWLKKNYTVQAVIESPPGAYKNRATDISSLLVVIDKKPHAFDNVDTIEAYAHNQPQSWEQYAALVESVPPRSPEAVANGHAQLRTTSTGPDASGLVDPNARAGIGSADVDNIGKPATPRASEGDTVRPNVEPVEHPTDGTTGRGGVTGDQPGIEPVASGDNGNAGQPTAETGDTRPAVVEGITPGLPRKAKQPVPYTDAFKAKLDAGKAAVKDSRSFTEYVGRGPLEPGTVVHPHPSTVVETKGLAGVPYPPLDADYRPSPSVMRAMENRTLSYDGNLDPIWAAVQQNDKYHMGMLIADDVGMGKSRTAAGFVIDRIEKGKKKILVVTKDEPNILNLMNQEFPQVYAGMADENGAYTGDIPKDFPAKRIFLKGENFPEVKNGSEPIPTFEEPVVYFIASSEFANFADKLKDLQADAVVVDEAHSFKNVTGKTQIGAAWTTLHKDWLSRDVSLLYLTATPGTDLADLRYLYGLKVWGLDGFDDWIKIITGQESPEKVKQRDAAKGKIDEFVSKVQAARDEVSVEPAMITRWSQEHEGLKVGEVGFYRDHASYVFSYGGRIFDDYFTNPKTETEAILMADLFNRALDEYSGDKTDYYSVQGLLSGAREEYQRTYSPPDRADLSAVSMKDASDVIGKAEKGGWGKKGLSAFEVTLPPAHTEQIMRELKVTGSYMSRDISRAGVDFSVKEYKPPVEAKASFDKRVQFYRRMSDDFERFGAMNEGPKKAAAMYGINGKIQADAKRALFNMRLPGVIEEADAAIARGEQVVLSLVSVSETSADSGNLISAIDMINTHEVRKLGKDSYSDPTDIPEALVEVMTLKEDLRDMGVLPSPIDLIREKYGDRVSFVTGKESAKDRMQAQRDFQNNKLDVIVISSAGKTGINLHDVTGKKRVHLIVGDYEWSATNFKQELGRVDRTGQRSSPKVTVMHTGSAGERKFVATISNRIKGLGATSKGGSESTGTGAMTDEFELGSTIDKIALDAAWQSFPVEWKSDFMIDRYFRDPQVPGLPRSHLDTTADAISKFLLGLQKIEIDTGNKIMQSYMDKRAEMMSSGAEHTDAEAAKAAANTGEILRTVELGDNLRMSEVRNQDGNKFAVLDGVLTPHMNAIKNTVASIGDSERYLEGGNAWMRWVQFYDPEKQTYVTGLKINPGKIKDVAEHFGRILGSAHKPETAISDLRSGDKIKVIGANGSEWELYLGRGGAREDKIVIDNARIRDKDALMGNGAQYSAIGGFFYVTPESIDQFFKRFPIRNDEGAAPKELYYEDIPTGAGMDTLDPEGKLPPNSYDQLAKWFPEGAAWDELYGEKVGPLLDGLKTKAKTQPALRADNLNPETLEMLNQYGRQVKSDMGTAKLNTMRWAETRRDNAMLNYQRKFGLDNVLNPVFPYQFWTTRSMGNWAWKILDRPAIFSNYYRLNAQMNRYQRDLPERMRGKIKIPMPFLPDWAGDGIFIDPMKQIFPFVNFTQPLNTLVQEQGYQANNATYILKQWAESGEISNTEYEQAIQDKTGAIYERALAEAGIQMDKQISNPFDFASLMLGPAMYLSLPLNLAGMKTPISSGDKGDIGQTPMARFGGSLETATKGTGLEWLGQIGGMIAAPERFARKKFNLDEYGGFTDYYIDRQLANMAADGIYTAQQVQQAMIERSGAIFDEAKQRVDFEQMARTPGALSLYSVAHGKGLEASTAVANLMPGSVMSEGELTYMGLKQKWNDAWKRYDAGDKEAINNFFVDHPEYEARLALRDTPEERLRQMMVSEVWDRYMSLDKSDRRMVNSQLGGDFEDMFLNKETRSYESIPVETLATWSRMLGGATPKTAETEDVLAIPEPKFPKLIGLPSSIKPKVNDFYTQRDEKYKDAIVLQDMYYSIPDTQKASRRAFTNQFPQLVEYWDWRRDYIKQHPEVEPFLSQTAAEDIMNGKKKYTYMDQASLGQVLEYYYTPEEASAPSTIQTKPDYFKELSPLTQRQVVDYSVRAQKPTTGAMMELRRIWEAAGKPTKTLDEFLQVVAQTAQ